MFRFFISYNFIFVLEEGFRVAQDGLECPYVAEDSLELLIPLPLLSQALGLKARATTTRPHPCFLVSLILAIDQLGNQMTVQRSRSFLFLTRHHV